MNMRFWLMHMVIAGSCFVHVPSPAQTLPVVVTQALQAAHIPPEALAVYVQEVTAADDVTPWISWQPDVPMHPASTMKLVTSYAALNLLGPAYHWKTSVYSTGHLNDEVLHGDLYLQGGGDPHMVQEQFGLLLRQIRALGIRQIAGDVILDSSWMEAQTTRPVHIMLDRKR